MANVIDVIKSGPITGGKSIEGGQTQTVPYIVRFDAFASTNLQVAPTASANGMAVPRIGEGLPEDPTIAVLNYSLEELTPTDIKVGVNYARYRRNKPPGTEDDPTLEPYTRDWSNEPRQIAMQSAVQVYFPDPTNLLGSPKEDWVYKADADGEIPICNSSAEPFANPPNLLTSDVVLSVNGNFKNIDVGAMIQYATPCALNNDNFRLATINRTVSKGQCLFQKFRAVEKYHPKILTYYAVSVEVHFRWEGWTHWLLDQGTYELVTINSQSTVATLRPIKDKFGAKITKPVLLDGFGRALPLATQNVAGGADHRSTQVFRSYRASPNLLPFAPWGL